MDLEAEELGGLLYEVLHGDWRQEYEQRLRYILSQRATAASTMPRDELLRFGLFVLGLHETVQVIHERHAAASA